MSSKRRARSTPSSSSNSGSGTFSSQSGSSTSSSSSQDDRRQQKLQLAKKRPRSKSPAPRKKDSNKSQTTHGHASRQQSPSRGNERSDRAAPVNHRSQRHSSSPAHRLPDQKSREYPYGDSRHEKTDRQSPRHERQKATDSRHRHDSRRQQDRPRRDRIDNNRDNRREQHASHADDRRKADVQHNGGDVARPDRTRDHNSRSAEGQNSKRHRSGDMTDTQAHPADASRSNRDATGLPAPPAGRPNQEGQRGKLPRGPSDRQNRWAQDGPLDNVPPGKEQWGKPGNEPDSRQGKEDKPEPEANFALSGKLAAESNTVKGVVLVHQEPPEARKPSQMWRLYGFKNGEPIDKPLYIHRQTCYLFGRERRVADVPLDHPSISKQHAVLQYRFTDKEGADGMMHSEVRPYLMDLGSANGTYLNNERIENERYYELLEKDMVRFGHSTREYVLLHAQSND